MVLKHANSGAQPPQSPNRAMALTRTTRGAHRSQYSPKRATRLLLSNIQGAHDRKCHGASDRIND